MVKTVTQKMPFVFRILIAVWLVYSLFSIGQYVYQYQSMISGWENSRKNNVTHQILVSQQYLVDENLDQLKTVLENARKLTYFDYWVLQENNVLKDFGGNGTAKDFDREFIPSDNFYEGPGFALKTIGVLNYKLTIGITKLSSIQLITHELKYESLKFLFDFFMVTFLIVLVIRNKFSDILSITKILQSKNRNHLQNVDVQNKEASILLSAASGYATAAHQLQTEKSLFKHGIGPAILQELISKKEIPYSFEALVVRIDLNGYTRMVFNKNPKFVTDLMDLYTKEAKNIIERFSGAIYQFIGDELIFIIKETDQRIASQLAISCVRSLFDLAKKIENEKKDVIDSFKFKASFARGQLLFYQLEIGYAFYGQPLVDSVRILSTITDKNENVLSFKKEELIAIKKLCPNYTEKSIVLTGIDGTAHIVNVNYIRTLNEVIQENLIEYLTLYRDDQELYQIFKTINENISRFDIETLMNILSPLKLFKPDFFSRNTKDEYLSLISKYGNENNGIDQVAQIEKYKILATLIKNCVYVFSGSKSDSEMWEPVIKSFLQHPDQRIRSNTLITISELSNGDIDFSDFIRSPHNRIATDALIEHGKKDFSKYVFNEIQTFLNSDNSMFVASGLYAAAKLYCYHKITDPIYFQANEYLKLIPEIIEKYLNHPNDQIKNRANIANAEITAA
jgi:hypothetical protein